MKLRSIADVIAFDQRGTGNSDGLPECPYRNDIPVNRPFSEKKYTELTTNTCRQCIEYWKAEGHAVTAYNTMENADDIETLRRLLGANKIILWGISYGSHLAFEYIRRYDEHLEKAIFLPSPCGWRP